MNDFFQLDNTEIQMLETALANSETVDKALLSKVNNTACPQECTGWCSSACSNSCGDGCVGGPGKD